MTLDRRKQAEHALRIYLERGAKALACLQNGDFDLANKWLEKRDIAYRNFAALDHASRRNQEELSFSETLEYRQLIEAVQAQNLRLKTGLRESVKQSEAELSRNRVHTRTIAKFQFHLRRTSFKTGA